MDVSVALATYAVVPPTARGQSRLVLPGNQQRPTPFGIDHAGIERRCWGGTAVVL